ncbi:MAG: hypothetical protein JXR50_12740 [Prolixibacteraceae bacterium]|nr:hypothetical protein [Prolixibacteraceae bacterium]MBN2650602.1 hypothetical protein [Prolixibacteraceae bacterium]
MMNNFRNLLIVSIFTILYITATAENRFHASMAVGAGFATGTFQQTDPLSIEAGFAQQGFTMNFDGDYYLHNRVALSARLHFGQASINEDAAFNWLKTKTADYYPIGDSVRTENGYWQWTSPMLGLKVNYPLILNKLYIEGSIYSGLSVTSNPQHYLRIIDEENKKEVISENVQDKHYSIPLMFDGGLRMKLNNQLQIRLYGSVYRSKSTYQHLIYSSSQASESTQLIGDFEVHKKISTLNIYAGIIYVL